MTAPAGTVIVCGLCPFESRSILVMVAHLGAAHGVAVEAIREAPIVEAEE